MGEKSSQITHEIAQTRAALGSHLQELEYKVKGLSNWREQYDKRPFTLMGIALGGGILLGTLMRSRRWRSHSRAIDDILSQIVPAMREQLHRMGSQQCA
jgi:hypothetical protein